MNSIISQKYKSSKPEVGTPCTFLSYTDRSPGIVTKIVNDRTIEIASVRSQAKPNPHSKDGKYQYGDYKEYNFFPEEVDYERTHTLYTLRKDGNWQRKGSAFNGGNGSGKVMLGAFGKYCDPSF